ncbi:MAG: hypothetical protein AAFP84_09340 [Actinomycetota bacterium]
MRKLLLVTLIVMVVAGLIAWMSQACTMTDESDAEMEPPKKDPVPDPVADAAPSSFTTDRVEMLENA